MISMSQISFKEMTKMFSGSAVLDWVEFSRVYEYIMAIIIIVIVEKGVGSHYKRGCCGAWAFACPLSAHMFSLAFA